MASSQNRSEFVLMCLHNFSRTEINSEVFGMSPSLSEITSFSSTCTKFLISLAAMICCWDTLFWKACWHNWFWTKDSKILCLWAIACAAMLKLLISLISTFSECRVCITLVNKETYGINEETIGEKKFNTSLTDRFEREMQESQSFRRCWRRSKSFLACCLRMTFLETLRRSLRPEMSYRAANSAVISSTQRFLNEFLMVSVSGTNLSLLMVSTQFPSGRREKAFSIQSLSQGDLWIRSSLITASPSAIKSGLSLSRTSPRLGSEIVFVK